MTKETIDKLVVDLELSAKDFNKQADNAEQRYDDLSKNLDKTSNKIKLKSKKAKKDLSGITKETNKAGDAFKSSGKSTEKFFSPLTKGTLAFAAAAFTLKSIADGLANVAQRFADVSTLSKETGISQAILTARANTEEYFNIQKGTYARAAQMAAQEKGRWQSGQGISNDYQSALARLNVTWNPDDINGMISQAIKNANLLYKDVATRNQALSPLGAYGYGTNNFSEVEKKYKENFGIEQQRNDIYDTSEKYRQEYVTATQELSRAFDSLAVALMPVLKKLVEITTGGTKVLTSAVESYTEEKTSKWTLAGVRNKAVELGKVSNNSGGFDKMLHDFVSNSLLKNHNDLSAPSINNQTNNITNNIKITTNDPAKVIQNLPAKGIQHKNLTSNYMSSR